jgi:predicted permease
VNALAQLLPIFGQTVLPVFLVAAVGWILARSFTLDGRTLGRVLFYAASPALVFRSLYEMELTGSALRDLLVVSALIMVLTAALGWLAGWGMPRPERAAVTLTSGISNNGNMGIPINLFAFGEAAVSLASVYYVVSAVLTNTLGSVIASAGKAPIREAFGQVARLPVLYAAILGLVMNQWRLPLYTGIFRAVDLLAGAAIPMMLVLLGIQLRNTSILQRRQGVLRASAIRLLAGPLIAVALAAALGITGLERNVLIMQGAMPTAVVTSVLATEFDTAPHLVAAVIVTSTLLSMLTLSVILTFLL